MNVNAFLQEDYENEQPSGPKKTNPNKANFKGMNVNFCTAGSSCFCYYYCHKSTEQK